MEVIWTGKAINELVRQVAAEVETMCSGFSKDEFYPGSTEVLESLIGKGKRMLGFNGSNGLTRYFLSMVASTAELSTELIQRALSTCRTKHVLAWAKESFSQSVHIKRREDLHSTEKEVNLRKLTSLATPDFL